MALIFTPWLANAAQVSEYELKTAYLYNFALFVTWPSETDTTISICTIGEDRFGATIEQLHNRKARGKRLVVHRTVNLEQAPSCHILYIAQSEQQNLATILDALRSSSVLTVSDLSLAGTLKTGDEAAMAATPVTPPLRSIITLVLENKRLMFDVDAAS
ncbi:MAG TPA: YfiR family protein, partial [Methylophilaceae bacterium]|nr:YfiR family protein [Methylophilaceae bacterium]